MENKNGYFMNIKDKIVISEERCCPPHYLPHKLPIGEKVFDERCHVHRAKWRMAHHVFFCKYLKCPNYEFMVEKNKEFLENQ